MLGATGVGRIGGRGKPLPYGEDGMSVRNGGRDLKRPCGEGRGTAAR
ncbi:MAG: hypothetical protein IKF98_11740 [Clostridia bacterium]|nr:hypothetical protein [Clostridia bacterium]